MSNDLARSFLETVAGYADDTDGRTPSQDRPIKLGTIDPLYANSGPPKVLFDGETVMGVKTYPWVGRRPRPGDRVALAPQGRGYVILGSVSVATDADTGWQSYAVSINNVTVGNGTLTGRYRRLGNTVDFRIRLVLGSTSAVTSTPVFGLPFFAVDVVPVSLTALITSTGNNIFPGLPQLGPSYVLLFSVSTGGGVIAQAGAINSTNPFTWKAGDVIDLGGSYEGES